MIFCDSCIVAEVQTTLTGFTETGVQKRLEIFQFLNRAVWKKQTIAIRMWPLIQTQFIIRYDPVIVFGDLAHFILPLNLRLTEPSFNPLGPNYLYANSPNRSLYISLKNELREFDKRSKHFLLGDHFINSHNLISWQCMDIVRRKLMWVTIGT